MRSTLRRNFVLVFCLFAPAIASANPVILNGSSLIAFCIVAFWAFVLESGIVAASLFQRYGAAKDIWRIFSREHFDFLFYISASPQSRMAPPYSSGAIDCRSRWICNKVSRMRGPTSGRRFRWRELVAQFSCFNVWQRHIILRWMYRQPQAMDCDMSFPF